MSYQPVSIINSISMLIGASLLFCYPLIKKIGREKRYRVTDPDSDNEQNDADVQNINDKESAG